MWMNNPKSFATFLEGFNVGTILSLIILGSILLKSQSVQAYSLILILILTCGGVIGVVRQYLLIQLTIMKNMSHSFKCSQNQIPKRLLEMKNNKLLDTLHLLVGISLRLRMNMGGVIFLTILLVMTLFLPTLYTYYFSSKMMIVSLIWNMGFIIYTFKMVGEIKKNYYYLQNQTTYLLEINQFNPAQIGQKQG